MPFMKALPNAFSDQPYLPVIPKGKRTIYTEPPLLKKAWREAKAKKEPLQKSKPPSTGVEEHKTDPSPLQQQRSTPWKRPSRPSHISLRQQRQRRARTGTPQFQAGNLLRSYFGTPLKMRILSDRQINPSTNRLSRLPRKE